MDYPFPKKSFRITCVGILLNVFLVFSAYSQKDRVQAHSALAEKIYLQTDGQVYTTDQLVWFKSIVASAANHVPKTQSGVLYVELINPNEQVIEKKLVKITNGTGDNFFELNENYVQGRYLIRAYTTWNKNFGNIFTYKTYINVFPSTTKDREEAITEITVKENNPEESWLSAGLEPHLIDSLHQKKLNIYLSIDGKEDSLTIKGNRDGSYRLQYAVPAEAALVTITMETENEIRQKRTVILKEDLMDVQFFPESGEMVHGLRNKIGFKILDYKGKGVSVEGKIVNEKDEFVSSFKSNYLGMGSFFILPDSTSTYYAKFNSPLKEGLSLKYPMPSIAPMGNLLSIAKNKEEIRIRASSNYQISDSTFVQVNCRGIAYYLIKGRFKEGHLLANLPAKALPEGIIEFTLLDSNKQPVAQRVYFNERPENRLKIALSTDQATYDQREETILNIRVTDDEGRAVKANLSVLVIDKTQMGTVQNRRRNILSHFLLQSELRGEIEDPGYYFREEHKNRLHDLDALLLTQGWRKYNYQKPLQDTLLFQPEPALHLSGTVGGVLFGNNKKEGVNLTMMTFGENPSILKQTTDSLGRFYFNIHDQYGKNLEILIQSTNKRGKEKNFSISFDEKTSPEIFYDHEKLIEKPDSVIVALAQKQQERKMRENSFEFSSGITELDEVLLDGYNMTHQRKKVMETYGKPDIVIPGKAIQEKEKKWSYGLYSVLLYNFPEDIRIKRVGGAGGQMRAEVLGGAGMTLIVVDGIPVQEYNYNMIPYIPPSEVRSVEIIKFANNWTDLYSKTYQRPAPNQWGDIIAIYTHAGNGIFDVQRPTGILKTTIPGFSPKREFYSPKHENLTSEDWAKPDLRTLLFWKPQLEVDNVGNASTSFYNADSTGEKLVVVEAISEYGEIGYQEIIYEVQEKR